MIAKTIRGLKTFFKNIFSEREEKTPVTKLKLNSYKLFAILTLIVLNILLVVIIWLKPISFVYIPDNVFISNLTASSATISWTTKRPAESIILLSENQNFPLISTFSQKYHDDKDVLGQKPKSYNVHHVTVKDLMPSKTYRFAIYYGVKKVRQVKFQTAANDFTNPKDLITGRVMASDKLTPASGVNVFYRARDARASSELLSTMTDKEGKWEFDLGALKNSQLVDIYQIKDGVRQEINIEAGSNQNYEISTKSATLKSWPTVVLKSK